MSVREALEEVVHCVSRGAHYFDESYPQWWKEVDTMHLDMGSNFTDILSFLFQRSHPERMHSLRPNEAPYAWFIRVVLAEEEDAHTWMVSRGLDIAPDPELIFETSASQYDELTFRWREEIKTRLKYES